MIVRASCWLRLLGTGEPWPSVESRAYGAGSPVWAGLVELSAWSGGQVDTVGISAAHLLAGVGELVLLVGAVAVYRSIRRDALPQTAERATWLWLAVPAMAATLPVSAWNFAVGAAALAWWALAAGRAGWAALALSVAVGFRPEACLLWPGMLWSVFGDGESGAWGSWTMLLAPPAAFTATIGSSLLLAGRWGVSVRHLQTGAGWREQFAPGVLWQGELVVAALVCSAALVVAARQLARSAPGKLLAVVPLLLWPLLHSPVGPATPAVLLAVPAFAAVADALADRSVERVALVAALVGLLLTV